MADRAPAGRGQGDGKSSRKVISADNPHGRVELYIQHPHQAAVIAQSADQDCTQLPRVAMMPAKL